MNLERFIVAQNACYDRVLEELRNGKKVTHWMWYIFPQIVGLGESDISFYFSIKNVEEAKSYLQDKVLGKRLREVTNILLSLNISDPVEIFGSIDAMKLKSSMTLFDYVSEYDVFLQVLEKYYNGEKDELTLNSIHKTSEPRLMK